MTTDDLVEEAVRRVMMFTRLHPQWAVLQCVPHKTLKNFILLIGAELRAMAGVSDGPVVGTGFPTDMPQVPPPRPKPPTA